MVVLGIKRVEVALSERERQQLGHLRIARARSGYPYSAGEYISTLIRRDWKRWLEHKQQVCQHCDNPLPQGCGGSFDGEVACWQTHGKRDLALLLSFLYKANIVTGHLAKSVTGLKTGGIIFEVDKTTFKNGICLFILLGDRECCFII